MTFCFAETTIYAAGLLVGVALYALGLVFERRRPWRK